MKEQSKIINRDHPYNLQKAIEMFEQGYLINILQLSNGNKAKASEMLGVHMKILEKKMKKYKIIA